MGFLDIFRVRSIQQENIRLAGELDTSNRRLEEMQAVFESIGGPDILKSRAAVAMCEERIQDLNSAAAGLEKANSLATIELEEKRRQLVVLDDELLLESFALYKPKFAFLNSMDYRVHLDSVRERQKQLVKDGQAITANEEWTVNSSRSEGRKLVSDIKKLMLRSFNNECDCCVDSVRFNNIDMHVQRIQKSAESIRRLGRIIEARITDSYMDLKLAELYLAFEYQQKKQEEKEEQRRAREEIREQQKLEQEIRQAREKLAKEKKHYLAAIKDLEVRLASAGTPNPADMQERLAEMRQKYAVLENEEKVIDYREQNAKAGYVYIISNIGAFGENIYKIGMTRRLEPRDRIDELSDASVPFEFDVHALIFSDDAPALEARLHSHFHALRLNKINRRKEFFRADPSEIEAVIRKHYEKVFDFVHAAPAEQYRESLLM